MDTVWTSSLLGKNLYVPGYAGVGYVKAVGGSTAITLASTWPGPTGGFNYKIGARLWKVTGYRDYDADTAVVTRYVDMEGGLAEVVLGFRAQTAMFTIETWDEPTATTNPFRIRSFEFDIERSE